MPRISVNLADLHKAELILRSPYRSFTDIVQIFFLSMLLSLLLIDSKTEPRLVPFSFGYILQDVIVVFRNTIDKWVTASLILCTGSSG